MVAVPNFLLADLAKSAFRLTLQPALFAAKREARYRAAGLASEDELAPFAVTAMTSSPSCVTSCAYTARLSRAHLAEYRAAGQSWRLKPWLGTACVIALDGHKSFQDYAAAVGKRTGDAVRRSASKARRKGYVTSFFHPPFVRAQMSEILGSKRFRSGGLVPYGLLGTGRPAAPDQGHPADYRPAEPCRLHWTLHWGVFATPAEPQCRADARLLVGFVKLRRLGSLVHALQIMGHGDHMAAGINDLMHLELVRWLYTDPDGHATGVTHYMYGALEHAGDGLASWKLRRGFQPMLVQR